MRRAVEPGMLVSIGLVIAQGIMNHGPAPIGLYAFALKHLLLVIEYNVLLMIPKPRYLDSCEPFLGLFIT